MDFEMQRDFSAAIDDVWAAWADPAIFAKWYGPGQAECVIETHDFQEGGAYRRLIPTPRGDHPEEGVFHTIQAPSRLVQGAADRSTVMDMRFAADGEATHMVLRMPGMPEQYHAPTLAAWNAAFDKLDAILNG